ncbi:MULTISPECIES: DUF4345 domain-containing protein [Bradyrhizobium]|jgi:uncharacterized protein YjeT (DUF2065 family)|uniref:Uncharacterized protein YjeT (DUF2065 family) n=1 Tax=Bradyrhizobium elkanii TaxID=29448 RepID=A0A8I1YC29_BRAEL|nr:MULTISPECIES: DUF4345 domain-containing protein [Bradyrhizobium]MBP1296055.1 uncharacterized protein YjeT (DUF2065 family) [Bradyrhizobium elkanii]MBP2434495.1 uncharacterized protein YjeT (DUF2065 family) [Bradyrhizobium elkanii]MBR1163907.1 DUF4345 domain-containing protein [Bradyrhizobium elkanii]MCP1933040.1 uncharacterized protein YjeT (DUF2065 family) [Bradyrhizobium elkanii]MCP1968728.1 uncharacterized protein YjeT (DUF2065 family) [Bradyrhizobium elkanii]
MGRRALQIATALLALVPILTGIITMLGVSDPLYASSGVPALPVLDSNLRFFGGVWLGLGLALIWLVPRIESEGVLFRVVWGGIFLGGIGRLLSMLMVGLPPLPFVGFTALEVIGAPLFVYWQHLVAKAGRK